MTFTNEITTPHMVAKDILEEAKRLGNGTIKFEMEISSKEIYAITLERQLLTYDFRKETGEDH